MLIELHYMYTSEGKFLEKIKFSLMGKNLKRINYE